MLYSRGNGKVDIVARDIALSAPHDSFVPVIIFCCVHYLREVKS